MAWEALHEDKWVTISQDFDDGVFVPCSRPTEMAMQHTELKTGACWRMRSETRCSGEAWGCHPAMGAPRAVSGDNGGWVFKGEAPSECLWYMLSIETRYASAYWQGRVGGSSCRIFHVCDLHAPGAAQSVPVHA